MKRHKKELEYDYEEELSMEEKKGLDLLEIFMMVRKHINIIMIITAISTMLGIFIAMNKTVQYKATTTLIVSSGNYYNAKNLDSVELHLNQRLATTYTAVAKSPSVMTSVIKRLDLDLDVEELIKKIGIRLIESTELIEITAEDPDPVIAMRIANDTGMEFVAKIKEVMTFENIRVVEEAKVPQKPEPTKRGLIITVFIMLGAIVGVFLVILVEVFHSKLRRPQDIEQILGAPILTHVPVYEQIDELEVLHEKDSLKSILKLGEFGKKRGGK